VASITLLINRLTHLITLSTNTLASNMQPVSLNAELVQSWYDQLASQLARYASAAYMTGRGTTEVDPAAKQVVTSDIAEQLSFLKHFANVIEQSQGEFQQGWRSRAQMYARSIQTPYWRGATEMLPLPAMPGQGTQCRTNCGCSWDVQKLAGDGNYDAYWRRGKSDSCQTCVQRERDWTPFKIRGGEVQ
jgi:hypothetical protein